MADSDRRSVLNIGDFNLYRKRRQRYLLEGEPVPCKHFKLTYDENGNILTCDDCHRQIDPMWFAFEVLDIYNREKEWLNKTRAELMADLEKGLSLRAAQEVERAWRSRTEVPICPHCRKPITAKDGFGSITRPKLQSVEKPTT